VSAGFVRVAADREVEPTRCWSRIEEISPIFHLQTQNETRCPLVARLTPYGANGAGGEKFVDATVEPVGEVELSALV
jgi:hypothetical protein